MFENGKLAEYAKKRTIMFYMKQCLQRRKKDIYPKRPLDSHLNIEPGVKNHKLWQRR